MVDISPEWQAAVLVCTNSRDPETGKASCGTARGTRLADAVKDLRTAEGYKGRVLVSKTGCLGVCSPRGVTVCIARDAGARQAFVVADDDAPAAVWQRVKDSLSTTA